MKKMCYMLHMFKLIYTCIQPPNPQNPNPQNELKDKEVRVLLILYNQLFSNSIFCLMAYLFLSYCLSSMFVQCFSERNIAQVAVHYRSSCGESDLSGLIHWLIVSLFVSLFVSLWWLIISLFVSLWWLIISLFVSLWWLTVRLFINLRGLISKSKFAVGHDVKEDLIVTGKSFNGSTGIALLKISKDLLVTRTFEGVWFLGVLLIESVDQAFRDFIVFTRNPLARTF